MNGSRRVCTVRICWTTSPKVCGLVVCCLRTYKFRCSDEMIIIKPSKVCRTYELGGVCSPLDSFMVCSGDWVRFAAEGALVELAVEFDDAVFDGALDEDDDDDDCVLTLGLWVTPITRTVGLPKLAAFISIEGADAAPNTNGMVACVVPFTESTVMFGKPF